MAGQRELRHAVLERLEIVFVFEPLAEAHCSMATHLETCPKDLKAVLQNGRVVPWYRLKEFQQVSLLQILRRV